MLVLRIDFKSIFDFESNRFQTTIFINRIDFKSIWWECALAPIGETPVPAYSRFFL